MRIGRFHLGRVWGFYPSQNISDVYFFFLFENKIFNLTDKNTIVYDELEFLTYDYPPNEIFYWVRRRTWNRYSSKEEEEE